MKTTMAKSIRSDATSAVQDVVATIQAKHFGPIDLIILFASPEYDPVELHAGMTRNFPGVPLAGCSTSGELSPDGYSQKSLVVTAISSDRHRFGVAAAEISPGCEREAGMACARAAYDQVRQDSPYAVFVLLTDGLAQNQQSLLYGAYQFCGARVPIAGGASADNRVLHKTFQLTHDRVLYQGVVGIWIQSLDPIGIGVQHGWIPASRLVRVTDAQGSLVHRLDGRPALAVYRELLGQDPKDPQSERIATLGIRHPLGMLSGRGEYHIRHVLSNQGDALHCFGDVRDGSVVAIMEASPESLLAASRASVEKASTMLGSAYQPGLGLIFSCVARAAIFGQRVGEEAEAVRETLSGTPFLGFYTYGEFARLDGRVGFFNGTLVSLLL